jgi:hypothetical protein
MVGGHDTRRVARAIVLCVSNVMVDRWKATNCVEWSVLKVSVQRLRTNLRTSFGKEFNLSCGVQESI